jgi:hypothetical protein
VPISQFEADAASGDLADFSDIEPCLVLGHGDYHPAVSRVLGHGVVIPGVDPPSSVLGGEAFLARIYNAYKAMDSLDGSNVWNTALLVGWDEPGGTTTVSRPARSRRSTRPPRQASSGSSSTVPATGSRPSWYPHGLPKAKCSTTSTGTPP